MSNKDDLLNISNGSGQNNMKKILIYVAIGFLVFVIGVIGFAVVQNNKNSQKNAIIPPETKSQPKEDNLFKQIPIENDNNNQPQSQTKKPVKNIKKEVLQNSVENKPQNQPENKTEVKKEVISKPKAPEPITIPKVKERTEKPVIKKAVKPRIKKPIKHHKKIVITGKYYIQVAALLRYKKPSKKFLRLITKAGYKYRFLVTSTKIKGEKVKVTKVLAGPFKNRKDALKALRKVKANITQNAFIFKVK